MPMLAALLMLQTAACPAGAEPVPAALSAWGQGAPVSAAADANAPTIAIGTPVEVALHPAAHLKLPAPPQKAAAADSHGGLVAFDTARAGKVRVALSAPAWIELVSGGKAVASIGHGHGPRCSGMRKIVDFELPAGRHLIQLSGSPDASVRLMVVPGA
ncbi:hypothetical protein [Sphingomonas yantingensis]|uniref:Homogentisate 1,2-dioxygenase n=1 Tax=Sphingomonas yantingensis TaxID=1241761 RepID=A0A7W9APD8_9SPHN|nr:hypothetical protein [Sphingomonas yantingensis]MBB5698169.1 hypothetical protein [Sphingomonas yantingensis]